MSELRWILLGLSILVFLGILLWSSYSRANQGRDLFDVQDFKDDFDKDVLLADDPLDIEADFGVSAPDPGLSQASSINTDRTHTAGAVSDTAPENQAASPKEEDEQHIVALHVTSLPGEIFQGKQVCKILEHLGLRHGKYKIYHRESLQNSDISLFSVANMVKPGSFDLDKLDTLTTPGLSFFLVLPGPPDPVTTFNEMLQTARQVAQSLGGELLDAKRNSFSGQRVQLIQDEIVNFIQRFNDD